MTKNKSDFEAALKNAIAGTPTISGVWYPLDEPKGTDRHLIAERFARWGRSQTLADVRKAWEEAKRYLDDKGDASQVSRYSALFLSFERKLKEMDNKKG